MKYQKQLNCRHRYPKIHERRRLKKNCLLVRRADIALLWSSKLFGGPYYKHHSSYGAVRTKKLTSYVSAYKKLSYHI